MAVYFFRHRFAPTTGARGPVPGRCMFSVHAPSLRRVERTYEPEAAAAHRICVDGFEEEGPGSNVDPNVFAAELPWFLSYCRADAAVRDLRRVPGGPAVPRTLAESVQKGDMVVFGEPRWARAIAVDTVLRVGACLPLPVASGGGAFALEANFPAYWRQAVETRAALRSLTWTQFVRSPDFVLNLADSLSADRAQAILEHPRETWHAKPAVPAPAQVVGTRCAVTAPVRSADLVDCFMAGHGFDFVPVGTPPAWRGRALAGQRPGVFIGTFENANERLWPKGRKQPAIFRLDDVDGRALMTGILTEAERLVHAPIRWAAPRRFSRFDDAREPVYVPVTQGWEV